MRAAIVDSPLPLGYSASPVSWGPHIGITACRRRELPRGIDFVRIDAGAHSALEMLEIGRSTTVPVMLDLPGAGTPRRSSMLTRSEFLVFAATESVRWVNLRDATHLEEVAQARSLLGEDIRLTVSECNPSRIATWSQPWWSALDGLVLDLGCEVAESEPDAVEASLLRSAEHGVPCLVAGTLLPSLQARVKGQIEELARLTRWIDAGCGGFLLSERLPEDDDDQLAVDMLRLVREHGRAQEPAWPPRPAARVETEASFVGSGSGILTVDPA